MKTLPIIALSVFFSCTNVDNKKSSLEPSKNTAQVQSIQGIPIFINAEPLAKYSPMGEEISLDAIDDITNAGSNKKGIEALANKALSTFKNVDFSEKLHKMVGKVRGQYPSAEGVIFQSKMNACQAIKFNE